MLCLLERVVLKKKAKEKGFMGGLIGGGGGQSAFTIIVPGLFTF